MSTEWQFLLPEKKLKEYYYFGILKETVIDAKLCSHCAACAAICPVEGIRAGDQPISFPNWTENCVDCGACIKVCPRYDYKPLKGLGTFIETFSGRSKRFLGQDGAMVSEFAISALEMGIIDAVIFAGRDEDWRTKIVTIRSPEQLRNRKVTGTKYSFADVLPVLKDAMLKYSSVGFVGTPCMISAVRLMQKNFKKFEKIKLAVGLFCTENFYHHDLHRFLLEKKRVNLRDVAKTDIKKGMFIVTLKDGSKISFTVKELDEIIPSGCKVCQDFSAVESDVSVGSVGSSEGFSTVIVRSEVAKKVADYIKERGYVEIARASLDAVKKLCDYKVKIHPYPPK